MEASAAKSVDRLVLRFSDFSKVKCDHWQLTQGLKRKGAERRTLTVERA